MATPDMAKAMEFANELTETRFYDYTKEYKLAEAFLALSADHEALVKGVGELVNRWQKEAVALGDTVELLADIDRHDDAATQQALFGCAVELARLTEKGEK